MSSLITCPSCNELKVIHKQLMDYAICDSEPPLMTLSMLLTEVKMWRSKDEFDRKMKLLMSNAILKQIKESDQDGSQMDSPFYGLN